jgi:hypothetical protein
MQPHEERGRGAANDPGGLPGRQAVPGHQGQQLPIVFTQPSEGAQHGGPFSHAVGHVRRRLVDPGAKLSGEAGLPDLVAVPLAYHVAGDAEQPRQRRCRDRRELAPRHQEGVVDHVVGTLAAGPAHRVRVHLRMVRVVHRSEPLTRVGLCHWLPLLRPEGVPSPGNARERRILTDGFPLAANVPVPLTMPAGSSRLSPAGRVPSTGTGEHRHYFATGPVPRLSTMKERSSPS